ncbi:MAG: sigma-70 family RNA polymerase sigma factor [Planctomycetales bacterium]|nr:sigma-70 family RNA polymerase sigma factor [Planctomycetales bacterium]
MSEFPETNYSLIDRVKDTGDGDSWLEFLEIYQPVVYRMARRRSLQDADAQDVMQQVFSSIARSIDRWTADENQPPFRAWLTTIARNTITTALTRKPRDRATGSTSVADALLHEPAANELEAELEMEARREIVLRAAELVRPEFTKQSWDIFWKTAMEEIPAKEVAQQTGRSVGAIYVARHRVLARLKERITESSHQWDLLEE